VPWASVSNRAFAYLADITGDPFYANYYKLLIQTQLSYQQYDEKYPWFASVLARTPDMAQVPFGEVTPANSRRPYDRLRETIGDKIGVWLIWYTSFFLEDMTAPYEYEYFGGKDWGVGMDYELPFKPNFGGGPFVTAATTRLTAAGWNSQEKSLYAVLNGESGGRGTLKVKWDGAKYPAAGITVQIDGKAAANSTWHFDAENQTLRIEYMHREPTLRVDVLTR